MKNKYLLLRFYGYFAFLFVLLSSCNNYKYLQDVPYKFKYDISAIKNMHGLTEDVPLTESNDYTKHLSDREILLKETYAITLNVQPAEITNYKLYNTVDSWLGKNHKTVGVDENSISMGALAQLIYQDAYNVKLPAYPIDIFNSPNIDLFLGRKFLNEGDIIFFRYNKDNPVSDIGIYLKNDIILASTPTDGIALFDFNSAYFQLRYLCAGRIKITEK